MKDHRAACLATPRSPRRLPAAGAAWICAPWCVAAVIVCTAWARPPVADPPRVATFECDITPPLGQPLFSGDPLKTVAEPLLAKGVVLESKGKRVVLCALDWCMVSNGTHLSMRRRLAEAVGGSPDDVAVQTLHQHNAPMADIDAQRLLAQHGDATAHIDPEWLDATERRMADAACEAVARLAPFDRVGTGKGQVERVASSRRVRDAQGRIPVRMSLAAPALRELPEGTIDPFMRTVTFAAGDKPLARLHYYATHPHVKYNDGIATSDFVGMAREALEDREGVFQIYFTGCGGDITVGKYNDGTPAARQAFADRLLAGMTAAIDATAYEPVEGVAWRAEPVVLPRRDDADFTDKVCLDRIRDPKASPVQKLYRSAMRISSLHRGTEPIVIGCLEAGNARILHLPGEPLLDFQLSAQRMCPDRFVAVAGYGDNTTGYIPPAAEFPAGGYEPSVAICKPEAEGIIKRAMAGLLGVESPAESKLAAADAAAAGMEPLPRVAPHEPAAALATFKVAPGYSIEQVAAEPLVHSPVAVDYDERGRMFVVEMIDYSEQENDHLGAVRVLEDADGDSRYDTSTVFAKGLSWPTGVLCYDGGVFVCAAPDIWYLKDTDGDGAADVRRVVFTGFGRSNVQGLVNSLRWTLDCRVHGATSSSGAKVTRPDDPAFAAVTLNGRDFSFDPRRLDLRPESGCLQHGMSFDDWGRKFVSGNSQPLEMVFYEDRYAARTPFHAMPPSRGSIAVGGGAAEVFRTSPVEAWRELRTKMRIANPKLGPVEGGGRAAGYFTGATGVTACRGDAYAEEMRACLVVGDVGGNLVHREQLSARGLFLEARRIDPRSEFVSSSDIWFRPAQFANAPDGTLHILDVYREVIEHPKAFPPEIKQQLDLTSGQDRGRVYRLVPDGYRQRPQPDLATASTGDLVRTLEHRNGWHRDTAARLIYQRRPMDAVPELERLARNSALPEGRMHALYALAALDRLAATTVLPGLGDPHPRVREHAIRLAERHAADISVLDALAALAADADPRVRYQLAFSLGEFPSSPVRDRALADLARRDGAEAYPRAAILSSLAHGAGRVLAALIEPHDDAPADPQMIESLGFHLGRLGNAADAATVEQAIVRLGGPGSVSAQRLLAGYFAGQAKASRLAADSLPPALVAARAALLDAARAIALDDGAAEGQRVAAVRRLSLGTFVDSRSAFETLLESRQPQPVQNAAVDAVVATGAPEAGAWLLERWAAMSPKVRVAAAGALFTRQPWVVALLDAVEAGRVPLADFDPAQVRQLAARTEPAIRERYERVSARVATSPRQDVIAAYQPALALSGDVEKGKVVFAKNCSQCHRVDGVGHEIGPSLAAFKTRGPEAILLNMLDPNREVNPLYVNYVAVLNDGRTLTGMIADETATSITLKRAENACDTITRSEIESLSSTGRSIMPEGLEQQIDRHGVADLLAYLMATP